MYPDPPSRRIVQLLVQRLDVRLHGVQVRLRPNGLAGWCARWREPDAAA